MKSHSTIVGPTGLGRIRSLLAFRHANPIARLVSTVLAFAIATVLVVGSGAAYAEDTAPTDTSTTTEPATETTPTDGPTGAPADESSAPVDESSSASGDGGSSAGDTSGTSDTSGSDNSGATDETSPTATPKKASTLLAKSSDPITSAVATFAGALSIPCVGGPAPVVGGFEIDGNTCAQGNLDWDNTGASEVDGFADSTGFTNGTSENDPPTSWSVGGTPNGKTDIGTAWAYSHVSGGNVFGYFAITNNSASGGTSQYDLEYNQLANTTNGAGYSVPNRSPGDLLFRFSSTGSDPILFTDAKKYTPTASPAWSNGNCFTTSATGGWCTMSIPAGVFAQQVNADGTFFEGAINISMLFGSGNCSGTFGATQIRSVTGNAFATSALKDYVKPLSVSTPSTCGKIVINKQDEAGKPLGGATFSVSPNPDPTQAGGTAYSITDNDANDKDPAAGVIEISPVNPDQSYTVTETGAPAGYLLPNPASQGPTLVGPSKTVAFTFHDPKKWKALTATKTATPTYQAEYAWSVAKEIAASPNGPWYGNTTANAPLVKKVVAGDPDTLYYRVNVTEGARTTSLYKVTGNISVTNPNDAAVTADISDSLPGATCLVDGVGTKTVAVPAGGPTAYPYICTFPGTPTADQLSGTNTAHVVWDRSDYPQVQGDVGAAGMFKIDPDAGYAFGAETTSVNKTVTVTDDEHTFSPAWQITWSKQGMAHVMDYSHDVSAASGSCSAVFSNTATITGDNAAELGSDSAYGKVCEGADLTVTRLDAESLTRTYPWSIQKSTTTPKVVVKDGKATATYSVTVTAGDGDDSAWNVDGSITVTNPNDWESVSNVDVAVDYVDTKNTDTCTVSGTLPTTLAPSQVKVLDYDCTFSDKPDYEGVVKATVTWDQAAAFTPNASSVDDLTVHESDWNLTKINDEVTIHDDHANGEDHVLEGGDLTWADVYARDNHSITLPDYSVDLPLPNGGSCADRTNEAWVVGDGSSELDRDNAVVKVCNPLGLSIGTTADGNFTRTYNWTIDKGVVGDDDVTIDSYSHTFDYLVRAIPGIRVDSGWKVSGTISVTNLNTDPDIAPVTDIVVSEIPNVGAVTNCTYGPWDQAVGSGETEQISFTCAVSPTPTNDGAEPPAYGGSTKATATWNGGSATSASQNVAWKAPTEVDKSLEVYDNKTSPLLPAELLGTATWNAAGTAVEFPYGLTLPLAGGDRIEGGTCRSFDNLAWLGGSAFGPTGNAAWQDDATSKICVNAGTWTVAKDVAEKGAVPVGTTLHYTLTAKKTGGVNPEDVDVVDDLSAMAPYLTGAPVVTTPGADVQYANGKLTWHIDELSGTETLEFEVTVKDDAYGVDLPNLVTSPGSSNCPDAEAAGPACKTDNDTPHYTLAKSSDAGDEVMPPYLGADGTVITYTLTVHNDSDAPINATTMPGAKVIDDLSKVFDDAHFVVGSIDPAGQAELDGDTLTWTLPDIAAGGTVTLQYKVQVDGDRWDETLTNVATPGAGGDCAATCTTTTVTPPYTQIQVFKVDYETEEPLAGAEFTLFRGEQELASVVTGEDGLATFPTKLQPGDFTIKETKAPAGYDLPINGGATREVTIDDPDAANSNFVEGGAVKFTFADPAQGQIALLPKEQFEHDPLGLTWVPSDGEVAFGDEIRYVMHVQSEGKKLFHDVTLTDYVPGYNPADVTTAPVGTKAELVPDSVSCGGGVTCTSDVDLATGLVTWHLTETGEPAGDFNGDAAGWVEFVVKMPDIPGTSPIASPGTVFAAALWNQAYLDWDQQDFTDVADSARVEPTMAHHHAVSNEVVVAANQTLPPESKPPVVVVDPPAAAPPAGGSSLPATGGPNGWLVFVGLVLLLGGATLVAGDRHRRRRS